MRRNVKETICSVRAFVTVRSFREMGAKVKTQGQSFVESATFPLPSIARGKAK
jgi:hypothetical protein